ncbi:hypothetical protein [Pseudoalteromonas spongiae]|uniref:Uncharacterized protein n=1 Tax=Pseudoalteromonas spongiae TaxID=298657 RepID=A0ABU8EQD3_9GAMM
MDIVNAEDTLFGIDDSSSLQVFKLSEVDDNDADGLTNREDLDDDNDRFIDIRDAFPLDVTKWQVETAPTLSGKSSGILFISLLLMTYIAIIKRLNLNIVNS